MNEGIFGNRQTHKLDSSYRIEELKPLKLLKEVVGVTTGYACIDFGSGPGIFALPLAELVGNEGKVYAIDNSDAMLSYMRVNKPPPNLILINNDVNNTGLNDTIVDVCLLAFILHEVKKPENLIAEAFRLLKPEGRVVIVEWRAGLDSPGPPRRKRISQEQIEQLFGQVGLVMMSYIEWTKNHYVAIGK
ncbi:class I SAM-dependent methyltransferase [Chloroflexota bacterium]